MAVYGVNDGHTKTGPGSGAVGKIKESEHTRLVGNEVRRLFKGARRRCCKLYNRLCKLNF